MPRYDDKWFEVWYSDGTEVIPHYILFVTPDKKETGKIIVIDPQKNNEICFRGNDYEETENWLSEDDFQQVEGRMFPDDYW